jgi:hypothetical protein
MTVREKQREIVVLAQQTHEDIISTSHDKISKRLQLTVHLYRADGTLINPETYVIEGEDYTFLMSVDPAFTEGKPEGDYREVDLWCMVDKLREREA